MTVATYGSGTPWCANIFYAYIAAANVFVFTSDSHTRHAREALADVRVAASIVLETRIVGKVQGLQMTGAMRPVGKTDGNSFRNAYLKRFPYAAAAPLELWILEPDYMKLTDNTLGFGKKLYWEAGEKD